MWVYFLLAVIAGLLILLHHYMPRKKIFWGFMAVLVLAGAASWHWAPRPAPEPQPLTAEERDSINAQQQLFADWYADYQRDVERLDHNWRRYHDVLENFKEDNISIQTAYVRLTQLEKDSGVLRQRIAQHKPPRELSDANYDLVTGIYDKTNAYAEAQYRTIALSKAAADPAHLHSKEQEEQSRTLQSIMNREMPAGLFIADEVGALRDNLTIPQDDADAQDVQDTNR